ncbi:type VII secretion system-associated protein [Kutzneria sp. NPDC052558]|uniref:type VII secretion system-associated protein n=1 Tax=Kutzneria sp. NPDC052558 TaxID=3364121 RepID=UPI0037C704B6
MSTENTHLLTITQEMREHAKSNPNTWLHILDPAFRPGDDVPPWGVVGSFRVDAHGDVDERFEPNPNWRPSPVSAGMPTPETQLERAMQQARTGYEPEESVLNGVLNSTLLVYAKGPQDRELQGFQDQVTGQILVAACTSRRFVPEQWPHARAMAGADLVARLAGCPLLINPGSKPGALIPAEALLAAAGVRQG